MSKQKCIRRNNIADEDYVVLKTKRSITSLANAVNFSQRTYKTKHDWAGKVIHWELCKKFTFDHTNK